MAIVLIFGCFLDSRFSKVLVILSIAELLSQINCQAILRKKKVRLLIFELIKIDNILVCHNFRFLDFPQIFLFSTSL